MAPDRLSGVGAVGFIRTRSTRQRLAQIILGAS